MKRPSLPRAYLGDKIIAPLFIPLRHAHKVHKLLHRKRIRHIWWRRRGRLLGIPPGCVCAVILVGRGKDTNATDFLKVYERRRG